MTGDAATGAVKQASDSALASRRVTRSAPPRIVTLRDPRAPRHTTSLKTGFAVQSGSEVVIVATPRASWRTRNPSRPGSVNGWTIRPWVAF